MRGSNPIRPPVQDGGQFLEVVKLFPTLQGEGPYAGRPAVFIRLGGCNLACSFCDTAFEEFAPMKLEAILARISELAQEDGVRVRDLIVITGGEPLRQNIVPLCEALVADSFTVQIETNGTIFRPLPKEVELVCSPKNTGKGYFPLRDDVLSRVNALKFIISKTDPLYTNVGEVGQGAHPIPVYVQPMDESDPVRNAANTAYAAELAQRHGYRLSLQLHKMLGIE